MKISKQFSNFVLVLGIVALVGTSLIVLQKARFNVAAKQSKTAVPHVVSKVKNLDIVSVTIQREGTPDAIAVIEVQNNSGKPIIAFAVESGDDKDASGNTINGFGEGGSPPVVVLEPYQTRKVTFPLSNVQPGHPIRVAGVMYADGTEDGDEITLGTMRRQKAHHKKSKP